MLGRKIRALLILQLATSVCCYAEPVAIGAARSRTEPFRTRCTNPFDAAVMRHYARYFFGNAAAQHLIPALNCERGTYAPRYVEQLLASRYLRAGVIGSSMRPPETSVDALAASTGFPTWPSEFIAESQAKRMPRIIYRSPSTTLPMSVAQTLTVDGQVRETEIIVARDSTSNEYDFYAYDAAGKLSSTSDFGSPSRPVQLPAPQICLRCHFDPGANTFRRRPIFAP